MESKLQQKAQDLIEEANNRAEQLAEEAKRKADRLKREAKERAQRLLEKTKEKAKDKLAQNKREIVKSGRSMTDKVFATGIGVVGMMYFVKFIISEYSKWSHNSETIAALENAIKKEKSNGNNPLFTQAEYAQMANMIEGATNGAGTNTEIIYEVFGKLQNNADVLELIKIYGKRLNDFFGISIGHFTLSKLLISELSSNEREKLNNILKEKGITISF